MQLDLIGFQLQDFGHKIVKCVDNSKCDLISQSQFRIFQSQFDGKPRDWSIFDLLFKE